MGSQRGDAATKILFILVAIAIAGAIASPWLLRTSRTVRETNAIGTLRRIHAAQASHYGGTRMYASVTKLADRKLFDGPVTDKPFKRDGYEFTHTTAGSWQRWCAQAIPDSAEPTGSIYGIDESGIVKEFPAGSSPCYAGELQSPGTPIR